MPTFDLIRLIIYPLASIRIVHMLWWERGPLDAFVKLRAAAGVITTEKSMYDEEGHFVTKVNREANSFWGELLLCPLCLGVWCAGLATIAVIVNWWVLDVLALWMAMSCVSMFYFRDRLQ